MKRFVDIRGQGTGYRFAWFDTVTDSFESFGGISAFDNWDDFIESLEQNSLADRYKSLCPDWAFDDNKDDVEGFYMR